MTLRAVRRVCAALIAAFTVAVACKMEDPFVPAVTTITVSPTTRAFFSITDTGQFSATVRDQNGDPMSQAVTWGTNNSGVATVSPLGIVTSQGVGSAMITATIGTISGSASVTVTQVAASLFKSDGDAQSAAVGTTLAVPIQARVLDSSGIGVPNIAVNFAVTSGGGSVGTPSATSNSFGQASTTWTLGTTTGTQIVTASSPGLTSVPFSATALPSPPDTIIKESTDGQTVPAGTQVTPAPAVRLRDQFGNNVSGVSVTFAITQGGGQLTGATVFSNSSGVATVGSWIVGASATQTLTATATGSGIGGNPITFSVTSQAPGAADNIVVAGGDNQTGLGGYALNTAPLARVRDASTNPVQGVSVDFAVTGGGGSLTGATGTTDLQGVARVGSWSINVGANTMSASVAGIATPATFSATGVTSTFNVVVRFLTSVTPTQQAAFDSAAARWSRVIFQDVPDFAANFAAGACHPLIPAVNETIDDVLIFARLDSIDGPGQILGSAGPCFARSGGASIFGLMRFDTADVANLQASGRLGAVIVHEMAHVLGFGTLWQSRGLLTGAQSSDPFFTGAQARAAFDAIGGTGYTGGGKVPVENTGGGGTRDSHWRESVFTNELMTGFINSGANPLSRVTAAQFIDLGGYEVNLAESDAFSLSFPAALRMQGGHTIHLFDDILRMPIVEVDAAGRVVRVIKPQ